MGNKLWYHKDQGEEYIEIESGPEMCKLIKENENDTRTYLKVSHFKIIKNKLEIYVFKTYKKKVKVKKKKDLSGGRAGRYASLSTVIVEEEVIQNEYKDPYWLASIPLHYGKLYSKKQKECIQLEIEKGTWNTSIRDALEGAGYCNGPKLKITYNALKSEVRYRKNLFTLNLTTNKTRDHCETSDYTPQYKKVNLTTLLKF